MQLFQPALLAILLSEVLPPARSAELEDSRRPLVPVTQALQLEIQMLVDEAAPASLPAA